MNKPVNQLERRLHPRLPIRAYAQLQYGAEQWEVHLLDISLSGAKLALLDEHPLTSGARFNLHVTIEPEGLVSASIPQTIELQATLVHLCEHLLGVEYRPVSKADSEALVRLLAADNDL
jgi:c-di-GMP-binding flagellar brake protein YcgR